MWTASCCQLDRTGWIPREYELNGFGQKSQICYLRQKANVQLADLIDQQAIASWCAAHDVLATPNICGAAIDPADGYAGLAIDGNIIA